MPTDPPKRPEGDTIDVTNIESLNRWAAWLEVDPVLLIRIVGVVGSSAGQVEFILGKSDRSRW